MYFFKNLPVSSILFIFIPALLKIHNFLQLELFHKQVSFKNNKKTSQVTGYLHP